MTTFYIGQKVLKGLLNQREFVLESIPACAKSNAADRGKMAHISWQVALKSLKLAAAVAASGVCPD